MATITKVRRVANPRGRRRFRALRNKKGRFVKLSRATKKRTNTKRRVARRRVNPVLIELSALNPRKRRTRKSMATKRKYRRTRKTSANPRRRRRITNAAPRRRRRRVSVAPVRRRRRRRTNPVSAAPVRRRRRYTRRRRVTNAGGRRVRHYRRRRMNGRRRRNPMFGQSGAKNYAVMIGGGLVGVAAAKYIPTLIPSSITASLGTSPIMAIVVAGAGAFAAGYLAKRFVGSDFGDAVLFGGLMQTGSLILSAFAPAPLNTALALSGLGDIMPGWFAVPQNSVTNRQQVAVMPSAKSGVSGFAPGGFGFRRR
jgi:hypothetical protein